MLLLHELLKDWPCTFIGEQINVPIIGITEDSKNIRPGFIFIARKGENRDGVSYIDEALKAGAAAIIVDRIIKVTIPSETPLIIVADCRRFLSHASACLAGHPSRQLTVIAVTGTNGKTTVSHFTGQLLRATGVKTAVIGTLGVFIDGVKVDYHVPQMTTPPAEYLHPLLKDCANLGVTHVVLEASSIGLSTDRLRDCDIDIGVLLNIGADHYDEHGGKLPYIEAKKKLVTMAKHLIVNKDDSVCVEMVSDAVGKNIFFGRDVKANLRLQTENDGLTVRTIDEIGELDLSVLGDYNEKNALASIAVMLALTYELKDILPHTSQLMLPEGRMEKIEGGGINVIVDYAHTPDALGVVLQSLTKICKGKLTTVFGCGGNRDKGKRKEMGAVAAFYSQNVIVTSDNPRNEDPLAIIADIIQGMEDALATIQVEPDRERAIQQGIEQASVGDVVLIAGKGHEKTQHIGNHIIPFSDITIVHQSLLSQLKNRF